MPREVRWERMFPDELEAAFKAFPVMYFSYGNCEPHGPHNALGLDALKAHAVTCAAAREFGGIAAPPHFWHMHEIEGYATWAHNQIGQVERSWIAAVPPWHHCKTICYHIRAADAMGFHAALFLTGHDGPNWIELQTLCELMQPYVGTRILGLKGFAVNRPGFYADGSYYGDHAGKVETSMLWAAEPDCVDISRIPPQDQPGPHWAMNPNSRESDRRTGERMIADSGRNLGLLAKQKQEEYDSLKPEHARLTFDDVERIWEEAIAPRLKEGKASRPPAETIPADSVWAKNMYTKYGE